MRDRNINEEGARSWVAAVRVLAQFDRGEGHLDSLLDVSAREAGRWLVMAATVATAATDAEDDEPGGSARARRP